MKKTSWNMILKVIIAVVTAIAGWSTGNDASIRAV